MNTLFRTVLAGVAGLSATAATAEQLSKSVMRPTPVSSGVVAGNLPGGAGSVSYYIAVDLAPGALLTQLTIAGRANTDKKLTFELLNNEARVAASTYVMAGLDGRAEITKSFPVDSAGRYTIRLTAEGVETGTYCVLMGGTAMPTSTATGCPAAAEAAPPPPVAPAVPPLPSSPAAPAVRVVEMPAVVERPLPRSFEILTSRCEERLRVGSDFLFDFDRAEVRAEADFALDEIATHLVGGGKPVMIEGHTDSKGSDGYNQVLSERRALAIRMSLITRGVPVGRLNIRGFGKSRPVAPNEGPDGSDDPAARQKNRRVEVVVNTCS